MHPKFIECVYEGGIFRPLVKVDPKEGKWVKVLPNDEREEILDEYAEIIELVRMTHHGEIMDLGEDRWPVARRASSHQQMIAATAGPPGR